ncbi:hypothetical protein [Sphingobacterium endophyticum]|uniref:hypothetical protein n=1 Tax=Sphingobacterium endophyticum TaxID=2546448 RepID=UPI0012E15499|nr:hypothetical protein [Sphingobacterium endophyticum]
MGLWDYRIWGIVLLKSIGLSIVEEYWGERIGVKGLGLQDLGDSIVEEYWA